MHRPLLLLSVVVLGIASLGMVSMATSLGRSPTTHTPSARDVSTVLRYYDAVNEMIATGEPEPLRAVLHADLAAAGSPVAEQDAHGSLEGYLTWLHAIAPDTRLEPGPVASDGEQVVAQVSVSTSTSSLPLGFLVNDPSMLWPAFEIFRVSLGQITERRAANDQPPELRELYSAGSTEPLPDEAALELASYKFTGISRVRMSTSSMPAVFRVTSGNPVLSLANTAPAPAMLIETALDGAHESRTAISPGTAEQAGPGVIMIVPPHSDFSLLNVLKDSASLVGVSISLTTGRVSMVEHLRLPIGNVSAGIQLSLGTVRLSPGGSLHVSPRTSLMVMLDSPGEILLSGRDAGCRDVMATPEASQPVGPLPAGMNMLCPDAEYGGVLTNAGEAPVAAWIVAIVTS
jgi:hypothetical protein